MPLATPSVSQRPSIQHIGPASLLTVPPDAYSDSRTHGPKGPTRHVRLSRATSRGGGAIAKGEDESRCVVAGRESLRILRFAAPSTVGSAHPAEHKHATGRGGYRVEASRNFWDGSGLHVESASTDVVWGHNTFSNKILTSARNGELIMWDLNKSGPSKYEHETILVPFTPSPILQYSRTIASLALLTVIYASGWDLNVGQRGQLDRIPAAHSGPILALDWSSTSASPSPAQQSTPNSWYSSSGSALGLLDDIIPGSGGVSKGSGAREGDGAGLGWLASGGLDRCVKVWDLTTPPGRYHIHHQPAYTLRTSYPVRRVAWRPGYDCELAIVSNTDLGSTTDMHNPTASPSTAVGSAPGLFSTMSSPLLGATSLNIIQSISSIEDGSQAGSSNVNDPVEIWDVRRGYIAKWSVNDAVGEGGVTDVAFADSHAMWAQHSTGAFSQLDLRYSHKPLDAIPRVAATWDAAGSLAFVTDRPRRWEIPYDDLDPESAATMQGWQGSAKKPGDSPFVPVSQNMGTVVYGDCDDLDAFVKLAREYIYEGNTKTNIWKIEAAQTWFLLENLLTDLVPPSPPPTSVHQAAPALSHSISAPAAIPTLTSIQPITPHPQRSMSTNHDSTIKHKDKSPGSLSKNSDDRPGSSKQSPQRLTPSSSTTSSPHHTSSALPQLPATLLARRESNAGLTPLMRPRMPSSLRRSSFAQSTYSAHSDSPTDSSRSRGSHKGVGDGALEDSDSDSEGNQGATTGDALKTKNENEDEAHGRTPSHLHSRANTPHPSPLSQVADAHSWTEDEKEDEDSPSPASTSDSDSGLSSSRRTASRRGKRSTTRSRTRSRSSTVASLVVSPSSRRMFIRRDSNSSIQTVTAVNADQDFDDNDIVRSVDTVQVRRKVSAPTVESPHHRRVRSQAISSEFFPDLDHYVSDDAVAPLDGGTVVDVEYCQAIRDAEFRYRELGWASLREAFESFADTGGVQLCAFLAIVAPQQLKVSKERRLRLIQSYIDILSRLRLHTPAAYMRKFVDEEEIRATTTSLSQAHPCARDANAPLRHLPVRALLFKCPVCMHGGHQECYRNYYTRRPLVELAGPEPPESRRPRLSTISIPDLGTVPKKSGRVPSRSRSATGIDSDGSSDDSHGMGGSTTSGGDLTDNDVPTLRQAMHGHPCAAGCGHFCWAVTKS
ncbi:hypothetical protein IEO21_08250 [Rhodonia placenta]|uniref:WD40 repeat-like protein n=1 Tax=Rhodonia placenta TaxID=104341 RepID=A0A8H7TZK9_9APHY|nr:hypothetical protein IEO21_08250 [Postia placenta]